MNLQKMKQIEDLKEELSILEEQNNRVYESNIKPMIRKKAEEFLEAFAQHFKSEGFEVKKEQNAIVASYKGIKFEAQNDGRKTVILEGNKEITNVMIQNTGGSTSGVYTLPPDELDQEIFKLKRDIESIKKSLEHLKNPVFYYASRAVSRKFEDPKELISELFNK